MAPKYQITTTELILAVDIDDSATIGGFVRYYLSVDGPVPPTLNFAYQGPEILSVTLNGDPVSSTIVPPPPITAASLTVMDLASAVTLATALDRTVGQLRVSLHDVVESSFTVTIQFSVSSASCASLVCSPAFKFVHTTNGGGNTWLPTPVSQVPVSQRVYTTIIHSRGRTAVASGSVLTTPSLPPEHLAPVVARLLPAKDTSAFVATSFASATVLNLEMFAFLVGDLCQATTRLPGALRKSAIAENTLMAAGPDAPALQNAYCTVCAPAEATNIQTLIASAACLPALIADAEELLATPMPMPNITFFYSPLEPTWPTPFAPLVGTSYHSLVILPMSLLALNDPGRFLTRVLAFSSAISRQYVGTSAYPAHSSDTWFSDAIATLVATRALSSHAALGSESESFRLYYLASLLLTQRDGITALPLHMPPPRSLPADTFTVDRPGDAELRLAKSLCFMTLICPCKSIVHIQTIIKGFRGATSGYSSTAIIRRLNEVKLGDKSGHTPFWLRHAMQPRIRVGSHFNINAKQGGGQNEGAPAAGAAGAGGRGAPPAERPRGTGPDLAVFRSDNNTNSTMELGRLNVGCPRVGSVTANSATDKQTIDLSVTLSGCVGYSIAATYKELNLRSDYYLHTDKTKNWKQPLSDDLQFAKQLREALAALMPGSTNKGPCFRFYNLDSKNNFPPAVVTMQQTIYSQGMRLFAPNIQQTESASVAPIIQQLDAIAGICLRPGELAWELLAAGAFFFMDSHRVARACLRALGTAHAPHVNSQGFPDILINLWEVLQPMTLLTPEIQAAVAALSAVERQSVHHDLDVAASPERHAEVREQGVEIPGFLQHIHSNDDTPLPQVRMNVFEAAMKVIPMPVPYFVSLMSGFMDACGRALVFNESGTVHSFEIGIRYLSSMVRSSIFTPPYSNDIAYAFCDAVANIRVTDPFAFSNAISLDAITEQLRTFIRTETAVVRSPGGAVTAAACRALASLGTSGAIPFPHDTIAPMLTAEHAPDVACRAPGWLARYAAEMGAAEEGCDAISAHEVAVAETSVAPMLASAHRDFIGQMSNTASEIAGHEIGVASLLHDVHPIVALKFATLISLLSHVINGAPATAAAAGAAVAHLVSRNVVDTWHALGYATLAHISMHTGLDGTLETFGQALTDVDAWALTCHRPRVFSRKHPRVMFRGAGYCAACLTGGSCSCSLRTPAPTFEEELKTVPTVRQMEHGFGYHAMFRQCLMAGGPGTIPAGATSRPADLHALMQAVMTTLFVVARDHPHPRVAAALGNAWPALYGMHQPAWAPLSLARDTPKEHVWACMFVLVDPHAAIQQDRGKNTFKQFNNRRFMSWVDAYANTEEPSVLANTPQPALSRTPAPAGTLTMTLRGLGRPVTLRAKFNE